MKLQRVLMLKMSGEDVKHMQKKLKDLGFHKGRVDGNFGQDTLVSVSNFQRESGFKVDGIVSLRTWSKINNYEKGTIENNKDIKYDISYITKESLKIYDSKIDNKFYYNKKTKKNTIWIKNTFSLLNPYDYIGNWNKYEERDKDGNLKDKKLKTSIHYTIGGFNKENPKWDGKVIKNFDDNYWSYHSPFLSTNKRLNQMSISIEICNLGPLLYIDDKFYTKSGILVEESEVYELEFRGYKYWHKYTNSQIESLRKLLSYLVEKHNIDINSDEINNDWFEFHKKWSSVGGIRTDSQVSFEKTGINPHSEIIEVLKTI